MQKSSVHPGLKPTNILMTSDNNDPGKPDVELGDFGLSQRLDSQQRLPLFARSPGLPPYSTVPDPQQTVYFNM